MLRWEKTDRIANEEGTTITYCAIGTDIMVQSRKRAIPHANGIGTWDHTGYVVMKGGFDVIEKSSLRDAKAFAETLL